MRNISFHFGDVLSREGLESQFNILEKNYALPIQLKNSVSLKIIVKPQSFPTLL